MSTLPSDTAIRVDHVSKCYQIYDHPRDRLIQALWGRDRWGHKKQFFREFWALEELSFSLKKGQTLGVVGRNGSGKSTLLQLICGTLEPTSGEVWVDGRIGALLELGSGFNPEFSGLENVYLNAALLGMTQREIEDRLDQILAFADIGSFIHQPVKTYSSGMAVRLAFAVQAHIEPNVLVVDEALAVGDELFQKKCYDHLSRLKDRGTAVLLVTHSCPQIIQHCDHALLIHKGRARMMGEPAKVTVTYQRLINASDREWDEAFIPSTEKHKSNGEVKPAANSLISTERECTAAVNNEPAYDAWLDPNLKPESTDIYPSKGGVIEDVWIETKSGEKINTMPFGSPFIVTFQYHAERDLKNIGMACHIASHTGLRISGQTLPEALGSQEGGNLPLIPRGTRWQVSYSFNNGLWPGVYFIGGGLITCSEGSNNFIHRVVDFKAIRILDSKPQSVVGAVSLQSEGPKVSGLNLSN